ncbi:hypothetical protein DQ384_20965 [Sphaerisporangium album]|uniref:Uncharacterized protein n=1 Tax=Sphaerisporangium album TaxID=509200 RepID=A0A367FIP4_9ACTN|nr:hypothetical protein [Sphaerisporangium album]RCG29505.1 hypothetical protein DQ384_20965 [Sphaerisporangium album]
MSTSDTVSERRADEDAELLAILHRHLAGEGIRSLVCKRIRLSIGTETVPPRRAYNPPELIVYGADGHGRAKVIVRTRLWGTAFLVTPGDDRPVFQFPVGQVSEVIRWLTLLTRDQSCPPAIPSPGSRELRPPGVCPPGETL